MSTKIYKFYYFAIIFAFAQRHTRIRVSGHLFVIASHPPQDTPECGAHDSASTYQTRKAAGLWDTTFLPTNIHEALLEAERSEFVKNFLGDSLYEHYMFLQIAECEEYRFFVTPNEHAMSLHS